MRQLYSTRRVLIHLVPLSGNARNGRKDRLVEVHDQIGEDYSARRTMEKTISSNHPFPEPKYTARSDQPTPGSGVSVDKFVES